MGQINNHKSNFYFLILGCKSFAVIYSLKSGTHRHHQLLDFIPGDALPGLYCNCLQFLLVLGAFSLQFCLQQVKCMLNRIQVRWLTWPLHNIPLLYLKKLFGCFHSMLWVIVHLHCEAPSNEFWSIWSQHAFLHNIWPDQEHSPGGRCMCVKVKNQEKTSPEWIKRVHHKMWTIGEPQKQEGQIRVCQTTSKKAFTVLEQHPLDRWDKDQLVPEWWEEKSMEKERNCSWSKAYHLISEAWWW